MGKSINEVLDAILDRILESEGGLTNDKEDRGGITNYGVSLKYARGKPEMDLDGDGDIDAADIRLVTPAIAKRLFTEDFFIKPRFGTLPDQVWAQMFDIAVNAGAKRAVILLQRALTTLGARIHIDGLLGEQTRLAAFNMIQQNGGAAVNNALVEQRLQFYDAIIENNPSQAVFRNGWRTRARSFLQ